MRRLKSFIRQMKGVTGAAQICRLLCVTSFQRRSAVLTFWLAYTRFTWLELHHARRLSAMNEVFDANTNKSYDVSHLTSTVVPFNLLIAGNQVVVDLHVYYSNHCFTRSRVQGDPDEAVLFSEVNKCGNVDERVFCPNRYAFSLQLLKILASLNQAMCYRGGQGQIFYRLKNDPGAKQRSHGWYICGRLDANVKHQQLRMNIRSVHHRTNEPNDVRGQCRFFHILMPFYIAQKAKYAWL